MKYLFNIFYAYALVISVAYMAIVAIALAQGHGSVYGGIKTALFIFSCLIVCASVFAKKKIKIISSIVFFVAYIIISYSDLTVNAIFGSSNEGRALLFNIAFFLLGYIVPAVGILVSGASMVLLRHGDSASTAERASDSQ